MSLKPITQNEKSQLIPNSQQIGNGKAINSPLQGFMPKSIESLKHLRFSLQLKNVISPNMYDADCRTTAKNTQSAVTGSAPTGGSRFLTGAG